VSHELSDLQTNKLADFASYGLPKCMHPCTLRALQLQTFGRADHLSYVLRAYRLADSQTYGLPDLQTYRPTEPLAFRTTAKLTYGLTKFLTYGLTDLRGCSSLSGGWRTGTRMDPSRNAGGPERCDSRSSEVPESVTFEITFAVATLRWGRGTEPPRLIGFTRSASPGSRFPSTLSSRRRHRLGSTKFA
jgi:hypothetical protein